jgi:hypothetical protein
MLCSAVPGADNRGQAGIGKARALVLPAEKWRRRRLYRIAVFLPFSDMGFRMLRYCAGHGYEQGDH